MNKQLLLYCDLKKFVDDFKSTVITPLEFNLTDLIEKEIISVSDLKDAVNKVDFIFDSFVINISNKKSEYKSILISKIQEQLS